jgi:phosphatidate cytidylyltransferase
LGAKQTRYLVGTILVLLLAGVLALDHVFDSRIAGSAILVGMGLVGYLEFSKMSSGRYLRLSSLPGLLATGLFLAVACWDWNAHEEGHLLLSSLGLFQGEHETLVLGVFALLFLSFVAVLFTKDFLERAGELAQAVLGALLLGLLFSFVARIYCRADSVLTGAIFVFGIKLTDIGGYVIGSILGRTKILKVSPGKSLEGYTAGLILTAGWFSGAAHLGYLAPVKIGWPGGIAFGIILGVSAAIGDLSESLMKRLYGVKDSGSLLPEFGGVLDMIDSFIFSGFVFWALSRYWS